jgi:HlyD family secretion protein
LEIKTHAGLTTLIFLCIGCTPSTSTPALGTLERDRIDLTADSNEPIVQVVVVEGQAVTAGDILAIQDSTRAVVALTRAQADEAVAKSVLAEAEQGPRQQQIEQARARLRAANSAVATNLHELNRAHTLVERQLVSRSIVDNVEGHYEEALAKQAEAQAALAELLEGTRSEEIDQARARHAAAVAIVDNLKITLDRSRLIAPVDGTIESLPFEIGERPSAGASVVTLLAQAPTYARIHVSASIRAKLSIGAEALIRLDSTEEPLQGKLRWISTRAAFTPYFALNQHDRSRLSYLAEVDVVDNPSQLLVGVPVEVIFPGITDD